MADLDRVRISLATDAEREEIRRLRHAVYATELHQHAENARGQLSDDLDEFNVQIVAMRSGALLGFVTITPPRGGRFSIDKYFNRRELPFDIGDGVHEVRLLTVPADRRGSRIAMLLMFAALRWVESRGGARIAAIGRVELRDFYARAGLERHGLCAKSGAVTYELMSATIERLHRRANEPKTMAALRRWRDSLAWQIDAPFDVDDPAPAHGAPPSAAPRTPPGDAPRAEHCFHGGAAFEAIGERFERLDRCGDIINADVLDAWFPPAPGVIRALREHLTWLISTAPPQDAAGLVAEIAECRGIPAESIAVGAGSSALIHRALRSWLHSESRVLLPDPTYGEYEHVLSHRIGCRVERLELHEQERFRIDPEALAARCRATRFDLVVLVNPNNPTGQLLARHAIMRVIEAISPSTRLWIDEAYLDFEAPQETLEPIAAHDRRIVVCKSLSKAHALSGVRAAYLCGHPEVVRELRRLAPPWDISLPAQLAAIHALRDPEYARGNHVETRRLRLELESMLAVSIPELRIIGSGANWLLLRLPNDGSDAASFCGACAHRGLYIRNAGRTSRVLGSHAIRIAVKDRGTNARMVAIMVDAMRSLGGGRCAASAECAAGQAPGHAAISTAVSRSCAKTPP